MASQRVVWKKELQPGLGRYELPRNAYAISVAMQHGRPQMWFVCDPDQKMAEVRWFLLTGTGHPFDNESLRFVGTMLTEDQNFVFHVFEKKMGLA